MFKSSVKTWQTMLNEASDFASTIGEQRVISISHSCDNNTAVVVVWYWDKGLQKDNFEA
jgi:hypothetical protein